MFVLAVCVLPPHRLNYFLQAPRFANVTSQYFKQFGTLSSGTAEGGGRWGGGVGWGWGEGGRGGGGGGRNNNPIVSRFCLVVGGWVGRGGWVDNVLETRPGLGPSGRKSRKARVSNGHITCYGDLSSRWCASPTPPTPPTPHPPQAGRPLSEVSIVTNTLQTSLGPSGLRARRVVSEPGDFTWLMATIYLGFPLQFNFAYKYF